MAIKLGGVDGDSFKVGGADVDKIYLGADEVYSNGTLPAAPFNFTASDIYPGYIKFTWDINDLEPGDPEAVYSLRNGADVELDSFNKFSNKALVGIPPGTDAGYKLVAVNTVGEVPSNLDSGTSIPIPGPSTVTFNLSNVLDPVGTPITSWTSVEGLHTLTLQAGAGAIVEADGLQFPAGTIFEALGFDTIVGFGSKYKATVVCKTLDSNDNKEQFIAMGGPLFDMSFGGAFSLNSIDARHYSASGSAVILSDGISTPTFTAYNPYSMEYDGVNATLTSIEGTDVVPQNIVYVSDLIKLEIGDNSNMVIWIQSITLELNKA